MIYRFSGKISHFSSVQTKDLDVRVIKDYHMNRRLFMFTDKNLPYSLSVRINSERGKLLVPVPSYNGVVFLRAKPMDDVAIFRYPTERDCMDELVSLKNFLKIMRPEK